MLYKNVWQRQLLPNDNSGYVLFSIKIKERLSCVGQIRVDDRIRQSEKRISVCIKKIDEVGKFPGYWRREKEMSTDCGLGILINGYRSAPFVFHPQTVSFAFATTVIEEDVVSGLWAINSLILCRIRPTINTVW